MVSKAVLISLAACVCLQAAVTGPACVDGKLADMIALGSGGCVQDSMRLYSMSFSAVVNGIPIAASDVPVKFSTVPVGVGVNLRPSLFLQSQAADPPTSIPGDNITETLGYSVEFLPGPDPNRLQTRVGSQMFVTTHNTDIVSFLESDTFVKSGLNDLFFVLTTPQYTTAVPEPSTWRLLGAGLIVGLMLKRKALTRSLREKSRVS